MVQALKKFGLKTIDKPLNDLWLRLKVQDLPDSEKETLFSDMVKTVEERWLRRVSEKLLAANVVKVDGFALLSQDEKLELVNKYVPDSLEIMLEEIYNLQNEFDGVVAEEI